MGEGSGSGRPMGVGGGVWTVLGGLAALVGILTWLGVTPGDLLPDPAPPRADATIRLSPASGPAGGEVSVEGAGFLPNRKVEIHFHAEKVGDALPDGEGNFTATFEVPLFYANFGRKAYEVRAGQPLTPRRDDALFEVTG